MAQDTQSRSVDRSLEVVPQQRSGGSRTGRPVPRLTQKNKPHPRRVLRCVTTVVFALGLLLGVGVGPGADRIGRELMPLSWLSGASWSGKATDTTFAAWRGRPIDITGTWNDNFESQEKQWSVDPQYDFYASKWQGNLDNAVGGIYKDRGESWSAAANGAYNARWRATLSNLARFWKDRPGTFYLRFAHEFNGSWYPWKVTAGEVNDFKAAWKQFRALQKELFPAAKLVFCANSESSGTMATDWRNAFPGKDYVDVLSVDYYNQWPFITTQTEWNNTAYKTDMWGGPRGLEAHRAFAKSQGLPLALSEWSSNGSMGDSPLFMTNLFDWLKTNAGNGPGQILYEIQFNPDGYNNDYKLYPSIKQPLASSTYRHLW